MTLYVFTFEEFHLDVEDGGDTEAEGGAGHEVSDNALVGLSFVDLSELFLVINFDPNPVLQHVLYMLLLRYKTPILILRTQQFLEVLWMTPCNLNASTGLTHVSKASLMQRIRVNKGLVLNFISFLTLETFLICIMVRQQFLPCLHRSCTELGLRSLRSLLQCESAIVAWTVLA